MEKGEKFGYFWLVSTNVLWKLKQPIIEHHIGHKIYIAKYEYAIDPPIDFQKAKGWTNYKGLLVSPPVNRLLEISFNFKNPLDFYISKEPFQFPEGFIVYGDESSFTLGSPEYLYKDLVPTWEGIQHWLFPLQEKFWQDLQHINPETYLSHGIDYDVIVSKSRQFMADVEKICEKDRIIRKD